MGTLFDYYPAEPIMGKAVTIGKVFPELFISETDNIFCYAGICLSNDNSHREKLFTQPYYMQGKHSTDKEIAKEIKGFYRIKNGRISLDDYIDNGYYANHLYKKINCGIKLPYLGNYYAILVNHEEDEKLTKEVFGLTHNEMIPLLEAYATIMGTKREYDIYPKLTKSPKAVNYCDISAAWIPEGFPYVAFEKSGYDFSHVSLWGFYRHIQLLMCHSIDSFFSKALIEFGANKEALMRISNMKFLNPYKPQVTQHTFGITWF